MPQDRANEAEQGPHELPALPTMPDFQEEDFRHSVEYLEGFEDFMDLLPSTLAAEQSTSTDGDNPLLLSSSAPLPRPLPDAAQPVSDRDRRQFKNRMSQRRFRDRQKVSDRSGPSLSATICKDVLSVPVVLCLGLQALPAAQSAL